MSRLITAKFGVLEERIIHQATNEEIQMIKSLVKDISNIQNESKNASLLSWATAFLAAAFSAIITLLALSSDSENFALIICLIFLTSCLGIYFFWNWHLNKRTEKSALQSKQQELDKLFQKIEGRIPSDSLSNEYEKVIEENRLQLKPIQKINPSTT